jgi:hypothetical protein
VDLAKSAFLAVIDGPKPTDWCPWSTKFSELSKEIIAEDLGLPTSYAHMSDHRLGLLLDSREDLVKREKWTQVVGAIVDGRKPAESAPIKKAFELLCAKLQGTKDGWFRKYGFYIAVVLPLRPTPEHSEFWLDLKLKATDLLGDKVDVQPVTQEAHIRYVLPDFNRRLIFAMVKDLRTS